MKPKPFKVCAECRGSGRQRVQGVLTVIKCESCDGLGYISAKYYRKLIAVQRLVKQTYPAQVQR